MGAVDSNLTAAIVSVGITLFVGLITVAWRLGGLERNVKDLRERLDQVTEWIMRNGHR